MEPTHTLTLPPELQGQRLDKALHTLLPELSRTRLQELIRQGCLTRTDGQPLADPSAKVTATFLILAIPPTAATANCVGPATFSSRLDLEHKSVFLNVVQ